MSNSILNNVYNHYLTAYAPKGTGKFDTHKKSELRNIYNSIVKMNKDAPLYLLDTSTQAREYAVGMKENARELRNTIASLGGLDKDELLNNRVAYSTNEAVVSADFIGSYSNDETVLPYEIQVQSLASEQVNLGEFLLNTNAGLSPDTYSFDVNINDLSYEFQFNIKEEDTNRDIQERLARLISNADIGLKAEVIGDPDGRSSLRLTSTSTGLPAGKEHVFTVSDTHTSKASGAVDYFGLSYVAKDASNAKFLLNGEEHTSYSNHFTIGHTYEIKLNSITTAENDVTTIGLKPDIESLTDNIHQLVSGYNSFIQAAAKYTTSSTSGHLIKEMHNLSSFYKSDLDAIGLSLDEQGEFQVSDHLLQQSVLEGDSVSAFHSLKEFTTSLLRKTEQISLDPMQYVDKKIVAYKRPGHNFASPYITSAYSGMMFNSYC